jgi:hypothetical protein
MSTVLNFNSLEDLVQQQTNIKRILASGVAKHGLRYTSADAPAEK